MKVKQELPLEMERQLQGKTIATLYFLFQGIASLMSWNAVLSTLDYYSAQFPFGKVDFVFPAAISTITIVANLLMVWIRKVMSIDTRIAGFLALQVILLIILPVISSFLSNTAIGYWLVIVVLIITGGINQVSNSSVVGIAGYFPSKYMSQQMTGTGLGGIIPNALRAITLLTFPGAENQTTNAEIFFYYGISGVFLVFCIILHYKFIKSEYAQFEINKHSSGVDMNNPLAAAEAPSTFQDLTEETQITNWHILKTSFKDVWGLAIYMAIIYLQTMMLFPGVMLLKSIPRLDSAWQVVLLEFMFNTFDTTGKYLTHFKSFLTKKFVYGLIIVRNIFFFTFIIQAVTTNWAIVDDVWFTLLNAALFGLTNGYTTSALFIMGPDSVEGEKKEVVGFVLLNSLNLGISFGTYLAIPLSNI